MQNRTLTIASLLVIFFHLLALPGIIDQASAADSIKIDFSDYVCTQVADATNVNIDVQPIPDYSKLQDLIDGASPIPQEMLEDPGNSFFAGFIDAIKERYPFGNDVPKALINVAEDALIIVIGVAITVVITGISSALAAAGAASAGTVLVAVLITGAAIGLIFAIGSIVSEYIKGNKRDAGAKTFNLLRELILLLAGAGFATKALAGKTAQQAVKFSKYLEDKVPSVMAWLRETPRPSPG